MAKIFFRMDQRGKVRYYQKDSWANAIKHRNSYVAMDSENFKVWKNSGKRTSSNKVTDPSTGRNYVYDNGQFYEFDKTKENNRGRKLSGSWNMRLYTWKGENEKMLDRFNSGSLIDRSRFDRIQAPLEPLDVGTFEQDVWLPYQQGGPFQKWMYRHYPTLPKAEKVWEANNDHLPSGQSLINRNDDPNDPEPAQRAYDEGLTIAIDNPRMHASARGNDYSSFSPTYGTRQTSLDIESGGATQKRVEGDTQYPARALFRDTFVQIKGVPGQDYSQLHNTVQSKLNFTTNENKLRLTGAYRYLFKSNVLFHEHLGPGRGIDPNAPGQKYKMNNNHDRIFTYTLDPAGRTQGQMFAERMVRNMRKQNLLIP